MAPLQLKPSDRLVMLGTAVMMAIISAVALMIDSRHLSYVGTSTSWSASD